MRCVKAVNVVLINYYYTTNRDDMPGVPIVYVIKISGGTKKALSQLPKPVKTIMSDD